MARLTCQGMVELGHDNAVDESTPDELEQVASELCRPHVFLTKLQID